MHIRLILVSACAAGLISTAGLASAASLNRADQHFMDTAARDAMTQAHEGQLAQDQASRADVKDLAQTVVHDADDCYEQLSRLATKSGAEIPKGIDAARNPTIEHLVRAKGSAFDRQFANDQMAADRRELELFKQEAAHGQDADVKAYASQMVPTIQKELQQAQKCANPSKRS
jgi:putative membrane protein